MKCIENQKSLAEAQVEECLDCRARITSKELAPLHSVKNGILQSLSFSRCVELLPIQSQLVFKGTRPCFLVLFRTRCQPSRRWLLSFESEERHARHRHRNSKNSKEATLRETFLFSDHHSVFRDNFTVAAMTGQKPRAPRRKHVVFIIGMRRNLFRDRDTPRAPPFTRLLVPCK